MRGRLSKNTPRVLKNTHGVFRKSHGVFSKTRALLGNGCPHRCTEVAVARVVGINNNLVDDNFGVYHDELQTVLAFFHIGEVDLQPADVVEHLVAAKHLAAILPTTQQQVVMWRQGLEVLRLGKVLRGVFLELVVQALTGINHLHRFVIELYTETQPTGGHDVLRGQDTDGDGWLGVG